MTAINNLRLAVRLGAAFAGVLLLTLCVGLLSINRLGAVNDATADLATNWLPATRALGETQVALNGLRRTEGNHLRARSAEQRATEEQRMDGLRDTAQAAFKRYTTTVTTDAEQRIVQTMEAAWQHYAAVQVRTLEAARSGANGEAAAEALFEGEGRQRFATLMQTLERGVAFQGEGADAAYTASQQAYTSTRWLVAGLVLAALLVGAVLAWLITRSITQPVREAVRLAETVAAGDLRSKIQVGRSDEIGQLLGALQRMNAALVQTVGLVRGNADSVATASQQISQGNADLSQRTEEQASSLQQTAASMEQLTATVRQNADTARLASQLSAQASEVAGRGGEVVGQVVQTMDGISSSSRRIADIIGTIDGIAFQTNILALNAAVEAARAGEQGRGFAVVAGEVRSLAQRSAEAAREIKRLIGASVEQVEAGSALVATAGHTMAEIVQQVRRVSDLIGEISAASVEQSSGIGQIGDAVTQLDQVTQQNAALVEESAAAAESLKDQAAQLAKAVGFFQIEGQGGAVVAPAAAAARPARTKPPERASSDAAAQRVAVTSATADASDQGSDTWTQF